MAVKHLFVIKDIKTGQYFNKARSYKARAAYNDEQRYQFCHFRSSLMEAQVFKKFGNANYFFNNGNWFSDNRKKNLIIVEVELTEKLVMQPKTKEKVVNIEVRATKYKNGGY